MTERLLSQKGVARRIGIAPRTLRDWIAKGEGPPEACSLGNYRYEPDEVDKWAEARARRIKAGRSQQGEFDFPKQREPVDSAEHDKLITEFAKYIGLTALHVEPKTIWDVFHKVEVFSRLQRECLYAVKNLIYSADRASAMSATDDRLAAILSRASEAEIEDARAIFRTLGVVGAVVDSPLRPATAPRMTVAVSVSGTAPEASAAPG